MVRTDEDPHVGMQSADLGERSDEEVDAFAVHESGDAHDRDCDVSWHSSRGRTHLYPVAAAEGRQA